MDRTTSIVLAIAGACFTTGCVAAALGGGYAVLWSYSSHTYPTAAPLGWRVEAKCGEAQTRIYSTITPRTVSDQNESGCSPALFVSTTNSSCSCIRLSPRRFFVALLASPEQYFKGRQVVVISEDCGLLSLRG